MRLRALLTGALVATTAPALALAGGGVAAATARPAAVTRPAVTRPAVAPAPLSWRPPALSAPVSVAVGNGSTTVKLSNSRDYVLHLPAGRAAVRPAGLVVSGGHNVVLVGGTVDVAGGIVVNGTNRRRAMYLKGQTGTVFVEGVRFRSSTGSLTEGIDLDERLGATVALQNVTIETMSGSYSTNHADGVQTWAGPRRLLIDGMSMTTGYQGFFLLPNQQFSGARPALFSLRHVSVAGLSGCGYMIWRDKQSFPFETSNVYVTPGTRSLTALAQILHDPLRSLTGVLAVPLSRSPLYAATAGVGYRSPGYRAGAARA